MNDKIIYEGPIFKVVKRPVEGSFDHDMIIHPPVVVVVPFVNENEIVLIRQTRPLIEQSCIELPAGFIEPNELITEAANRELVEETGYTAKKLDCVFSFYSSPGFTDEKAYVIFAHDLKRVGEPQQDAGEKIDEVMICTLDQAYKHMLNGEINSGSSCIALMFAMQNRN